MLCYCVWDIGIKTLLCKEFLSYILNYILLFLLPLFSFLNSCHLPLNTMLKLVESRLEFRFDPGSAM